MSCQDCGGAAIKSGPFSFIGNNTLKGNPSRKCKSGINFTDSYYEITHGGESKRVSPATFNAPLFIGGQWFQLVGTFFDAQIWSIGAGSFDIKMSILVFDNCGRFEMATFNRTLSAQLPEGVEDEPVVAERSIEAPTRRRRKKAKAKLIEAADSVKEEKGISKFSESPELQEIIEAATPGEIENAE